MPAPRLAKTFGPPLDHPLRYPAFQYVQPTPGLVSELFQHPAGERTIDNVRPEGVAAIHWTRDFRRASIIDRMVERTAWATAGTVLLRAGWPVGYESYPGGLSDESRTELGLLPACGLVVWITRDSWRNAEGYRIRLMLPSAATRDPQSVDAVLSGLGFEPERW